MRRYAAHRVNGDLPRTCGEDKADRVRASFNCKLRVFEVRVAADLDPHRFISALLRVAAIAPKLHLEMVDASVTRRREMRDIRLRAAVECRLRNEYRFPPHAPHLV